MVTFIFNLVRFQSECETEWGFCKIIHVSKTNIFSYIFGKILAFGIIAEFDLPHVMHTLCTRLNFPRNQQDQMFGCRFMFAMGHHMRTRVPTMEIESLDVKDD